MNPIKYSVLIPCYQTDPSLLSRCLKSILASPRSDIEIVLVEALNNGKSSFQSLQLSDSRVHYFISDKASAPYQRNITLEKATGDYIVFVDSDDYISPRFFEFCDSALKDFSLSDFIVFNHASNELFYSGQYSASDFICSSNHDQIETWFSCFKKTGPEFQGRSLWGKIFKHSIILENHLSFDLSLPSNQDHFFVMRYLFYCHQVAVAESYQLYHFDISPFSMSPKPSTNSPERYSLILQAWSNLFAEHAPSQIRIFDWAYSVAGFYIPRMVCYYFCSFSQSLSKKDLKKKFKQTLSSPEFRKPISACRYSLCLNRKKRLQLFLLKAHLYSLYFDAFWRIYRK